MLDDNDFYDIENDGVEHLGEGRSIVRGPDGTFERATLSSETARAMGSAPRSKKQQEQIIGNLLREAGFTEENAPEILKLYAQIAASGKSGAVAAAQAFAKMSNQTPETVSPAPPEIGQVCPTCGETYMGHWPPEFAQAVLKTIGRLKMGKNQS